MTNMIDEIKIITLLSLHNEHNVYNINKSHLPVRTENTFCKARCTKSQHYKQLKLY